MGIYSCIYVIVGFGTVLKLCSEFLQLSPAVRWLIWLVEQLGVCKPNILLTNIKPEAVLLPCIKCTPTPNRPKGLNQWRSFGQLQSTARGTDKIWSEVKACTILYNYIKQALIASMLSHFSYTQVLAKVDIASDSSLSMKNFNLLIFISYMPLCFPFFINTYTCPLP